MHELGYEMCRNWTQASASPLSELQNVNHGVKANTELSCSRNQLIEQKRIISSLLHNAFGNDKNTERCVPIILLPEPEERWCSVRVIVIAVALACA